MSGAAPPPSDLASLRLRCGRDVFPLAYQRMLVGRSRSCEIRLKEDCVSRLHAAFVWLQGSLVLEDLGSSNGTWVNGERIEAPRTLGPGDRIVFGSFGGVIEPNQTGGTVDASAAALDYTAGLLPGRPAGLIWRLLALLLDGLLLGAGSVIPFAPLLATLFAERYLLAPEVLPPSLEVKSIIFGGCGALWVLFAWYYLVHGWARRGGTPGMRLLGLRLIDWRCRVPIGYARAWLRLAAVFVTAATLGLGLLLPLLRRDRKTLHDLLAGTLVVRKLG